MSSGSKAIPLLKSAPEPGQISDRLAGGDWRGIELCLAPAHVASEQSLERAVEATRDALRGRELAVTAEAPVSWPSGSFVSVERFDAEARTGIERSARFAAAIGSPVLTIHLYAPHDPLSFRARGPLDERAVERFLRFYAETCLHNGVAPLIENVPPVLRMRTGGVYFTPIGGHWRDLVEWRVRVPQLGFTIDTSHAALFRSFAAAYPTLWERASATEELALERYVDELGPAAEVAHVSDAHGVLSEGLPYGAGELSLDHVVRRLGELVRFVVAEINEPNPATSSDMKRAYRSIESALERTAAPTPPSRASAGRVAHPTAATPIDWQAVVERRDPVPSVLELQERFGGRRVLVTGGGGSIAGSLASLLLAFRPERITLLDSHEPSLTADRRRRDAEALERVDHVLCDVRDRGRIEAETRRARPDAVFHLAAYKHVDWAEVFPEEFVDTNLQGSWNVIRAADEAGVETVVVASTDKAALAASFYGRTKRFMEQLAAFSATRSAAGQRIAVRFVNVLGSAGSASELFLAQARAGLALTVTDPRMVRYWITMQHAASLAAHGALLAADGHLVASPAGAATLSVGALAERVWRVAGAGGEPAVELLGIRRGETLEEVLTGPGEELGDERYHGIAPVSGDVPTAGPAWVAERLPEAGNREEARLVWLEAMRRPGLLARAEGRRPVV
jgi:nucleoside-diphosphate-sugar epimerase/sugar phosphate isomerase/epimerase